MLSGAAAATGGGGSAHGCNLFKIRRIFGCQTPTTHQQQQQNSENPTYSTSSPDERTSLGLQIDAMAVHTMEKKQLLALAIAQETPEVTSKAALPQKQHNATSTTNYLLLRTIEEDQCARLWKFPVSTTPKQKTAGKCERLVSLEFSPEGDWLAGLSSRKNRLHLIPVLKLIARQRKALLDATYHPTHNRELMSVYPSVMTTQMASYLRATNEYGGLNGARYHSQVAGDDEQMSTLEFAIGLGTVTCCRWWHSMNGKNYMLVGGTESLVSIVNVEENAEECRCELQNAGVIESVDLLRENFRKETRTTMLVKAKGDDNLVRYYRVVLEKKYQQLEKVVEKKKEEQNSDQPKTPSSSDNTTGGGSGVSVFTLPKPPVYVVKTFPQHFLQDMDFRPQRIKKNSPQVCLYAINGVHLSESSLALYDRERRKACLYSNFQWNLKGEYIVPNLILSRSDNQLIRKESGDTTVNSQQEDEQVVDVELSYCSTDLMLLQGRTEKTNQIISTWVSLPTHQGFDDGPERAHIVHYLSLHGNEKIERVVQSTSRSLAASNASPSRRAAEASRSSDSEIIYILQTKHHVYECRPQWSRLALFKALCARSITLRDAQSIGYALGIDMASLCQVAADTLCSNVLDGRATADNELMQWVRELYEVSRVMPSHAVQQLTSIHGAQSAIEYAQHVLSKPSSDMLYDVSERSRVALLLVGLVLQEQLHTNHSFGDKEAPSSEASDIYHRQETQEIWLRQFLEANRDYVTEDIVDLCLSHHQVDKALLVASRRQEVELVLQKITHVGLAAFVSKTAIRLLLASGHASALVSPRSRVVLRSFPIEFQIEILLAYPPAILQQRDWIVRNLPAIPVDLCHQLAKAIDPTNPSNSTDSLVSVPASESELLDMPKIFGASDVASSEFMVTTPEEHIELFLVLLLRLNSAMHTTDSSNEPAVPSLNDYNQARLEELLKELALRYRPPILIARCVDYENWVAAACVYEAHGELVDALECRLRSHKKMRIVLTSGPSSPEKKGGIRRRRQSSESSVDSTVSSSSGTTYADDVDFQDRVREEIFELLDTLVVQRPHNKKTAAVVSAYMRAAILARLMVKWFEYGLDKTELETFLIDPKVYTHVSPLLAQIFFSDVVNAILGVDSFTGDSEDGKGTRGGGSGFDDRDKEWIRRCHRLPFSGQFLFHVCVSYLESNAHSSEQDDDGSPMGLQTPSASATKKLLDLVKENVIKNDISQPVVKIEPQSAQAIGKSDPLETHVKVFTCRHIFPKRVFEEEILPEFEKRLNALPMQVFTTKQILMREFKQSAIEAPCPICSFNKISELVYQHLQTKQRAKDHQKININHQHRFPGGSSKQRRSHQQQPSYYFLHRQSRTSSPVMQQTLSSANGTHETWEYRTAS